MSSLTNLNRLDLPLLRDLVFELALVLWRELLLEFDFEKSVNFDLKVISPKFWKAKALLSKGLSTLAEDC